MREKGFIFLLTIFGSGILFSQASDPVGVTMGVSPQDIPRGGRGTLVVTCEVAPGYHINDATSGFFKVVPVPSEGVAFDEPVLPPGERESYGSVYRNRVEVTVPFSVGQDVSTEGVVIAVDVTYQPCDDEDQICYPPETKRVEAGLSILPYEVDVPTAGEGIAGRLAGALEQGSLLAFVLVFLGGMLTSLTPCVYPMIPVTIAVIGAQAAGGKFRGFILSLFYVLGIGITFSTLGILAARTGALFGAYAQHPVAVVFISLIFFVMGLSMLGAFVLQMPSALASRLRGGRRRGFVGALMTGVLAGLIVSPCISPLLVVILTWVARTGSVVLGFGLLFCFALGLGVLFVVIGTFSGVIKNLPKSGTWMELIEKGFGILLVVLSFLFVRSLLSPLIYQGLWAIFLLVLGTFLGAFSSMDDVADRKQKIAKAAGVLAVMVSGCLVFFVVAGWLGFGSVHPVAVESADAERAMWLSSDEEGFRSARLVGKPVLMDFFAEWCAACHELDEKTWSDTRVRAEMERFVPVKLDLTRQGEAGAYRQKYGVVGMPTVILFDPSGEERFRFEGFKGPEEVLRILRRHR